MRRPSVLRSCFATRRAATTSAVAAWARLQAEARLLDAATIKYGLGRFIEKRVLSHDTLGEGLTATLADKLAANGAEVDFKALIGRAFAARPSLEDAAAADLDAFLRVDPAADGILGVYLYYKGFHGLQCARCANFYWSLPEGSGKMLARLLQSEMSEVFGVDIHPGATFGRGVTIDHGTGLVIGETAVVGDDVYIMHDVTLGSTGMSPDHDRHPKIGKGVFLAAKCTVLGNITIGDNAVVGAQALVNRSVPPGWTAVGVPARMIPPQEDSVPAKEQAYEKWISPPAYGESDICI